MSARLVLLLALLAACASTPPGVLVPERAGVLSLVELDAAGAGAAPWIDAVEIDALDGAGRWSLGLEESGAIVRLRGGGAVELMNARLGVPAKVRRLAVSGRSLVCLVDDALLIVARDRVVRIALGSSGERALAASATHVAVVSSGTVRVLDVSGHANAREFMLGDVRFGAFTSSGTFWVASTRGIYRENGSGELRLVYASEDPIVALIAEGERLFFVEGERVGMFDANKVALTRELGLGQVRRMAANATEIAIVTGGRARRLAQPPMPLPTDVDRIVRASCASCHRQGGEGGFDLATATAFRQRKANVVRALETRAMPPGGRNISDEQRARLIEFSRAL